MRAFFFVAALAIGTVPAGAQQKQLDIGAADAPLSDAQRADLDQAVKKHDYKSEKAVIDQALAEHPESFEVFVMAGRLAYLEKHPADAADALGHADKIKPIGDVDRLTLALALSFSGKAPQSRVELQKLMESNPKDGEYPFLLGRVDANAGHLDEAIGNFRKAIQIDPDMVRAYEDLGHAQEKKGLTEEAAKTFEAAVLHNRSNKVHWEWSPLDLAVFKLKSSDFDGAEVLVQEALRYNPRFGTAHYYMGQIFQNRNKTPEALIEYKEAVVDDPRLGQAWLALARQFTRQGEKGQADRAMAVYQQLASQNKAGNDKKN
jgi:tetratricopeptide (TPR) repeat protein